MAIQVLSRDIAEKIAAGEVVDRPASVVKELVENSIDSYATSIEIEISLNGLASIRVSDNGSGIEESEVRTAFKRHATSKVCKDEDLYSIKTLGFRGEALAAISAVSKVTLISRTKDDTGATSISIEGGIEREFQRVGADYGTTIYVRDLFYNTPARMKFLKKDVSEGNAIQLLVQQLSLSHPEISFKFIREDKMIFTTPGSNSMYSTIYSILPRDIAKNIVEVVETDNQFGIGVMGYIGKPEISRKSRSFQYSFINSRFVRNATVIAAVEQAYRNMNMANKFPVFILYISMPYETVDVNVHPAKTEVRFSNEKEVFSSIYRSVSYTLATLSAGIMGYRENGKQEEEFSDNSTVENSVSDYSSAIEGKAISSAERKDSNSNTKGEVTDYFNAYVNTPSYTSRNFLLDIEPESSNVEIVEQERSVVAKPQFIPDNFRVIGEIFDLYILAQMDDSFIIIDKHAAHERILFEETRKMNSSEARQILLEPEIVVVDAEEKRILLENIEVLEYLGFLVEEFGTSEVAVREVPTYFTGKRVTDAILEIVTQLKLNTEDINSEEYRSLLQSISCRAAIKAGHKTSPEEMYSLTKQILFGTIPKYCPHGRNVYIMMTKQEIDRRFGR